MQRRAFLRSTSCLAVAAVASSRVGWALPGETIAASVKLDSASPGFAIPIDFAGLSYETQQLSDPAFFSAQNTALAPFLRTLSANGVLRLGGNTSANGWWKATADAKAPVFSNYRTVEVGEPSAKLQFAITPLAIDNLRDFLQMTGWRCIYGLNLANGTTTMVADEAAYVAKTLGDKLEYFQIGNEADLFSHSVRPKGWTVEEFFAEWIVFARAVQARVPGARIGAPDVGGNRKWIEGFGKLLAAKADAPKVVAYTHHHYGGGPPSDPKMTIPLILTTDPRVAGDGAATRAAALAVNATYRVTETNTCYQGGKPGVSDVFASALWAADYSLSLAAMGYAGINLHGGGGRQVADSLGGKLPGEALIPPNSGWQATPFYTPIAIAEDGGLVAQPEYYGLLFANRLVGCTLFPATLSEPLPSVSIHAAKGTSAAVRIAVINRDTALDLALQIPAVGDVSVERLTGPSPDAKQARLGRATVDRKGILGAATLEKVASRDGSVTVMIPRASAALLYLP